MKISVNFKNVDADETVLDNLAKKYHFDGVETTSNEKTNRQPLMSVTVPNNISDETRLDIARFGVELCSSMQTCLDFSTNHNDSLLRLDPVKAESGVRNDKIDFYATTYAAMIDPAYQATNSEPVIEKYRALTGLKNNLNQ